MAFTERDCTMVCHGCGTFHTVRAYFISTPLSIGFIVPGTDQRWSVPALGCKACMESPKDEKGEGPIRRAYLHGMTPDARAHADTQFIEWLPKLEAARSRSL